MVILVQINLQICFNVAASQHKITGRIPQSTNMVIFLYDLVIVFSSLEKLDLFQLIEIMNISEINLKLK